MDTMQIARALEWEERKGRPNLYDEWTANTPLGTYRVVAMPDGFAWLLDGRTGTDKRESLDQATAAAQDDFETRVRSMVRPEVREATRHTKGTPL